MASEGKITRHENYQTKIEDGILTITVNLKETEVQTAPSSSGKMIIISSTAGFTNIPGSSQRMNMTIGRKP